MNDRPSCAGRGDLFASGHPADHKDAARLCATCPIAQFAACARIRDGLTADGYTPVGTWAGKHHGGARKWRVGAK